MPLEPRIAIGVMGVDIRASNVATLVEAEIVVQDSIIREVKDGNFVYRGRNGENVTGDTAWRHLAELDTDWSIVLQDDALPIENFRQHAAAALAQTDAQCVCFYVGTGRPRPAEVRHAVALADANEASWLEADQLLWGVGVAIRTDRVGEFLAWTETGADGTDERYDTRIGKFFARRGLPIRYTWPSLVDHEDGYSFAHPNRPRPTRVAHRVGIPVAWDGPVVTIPQRGGRLRAFPLSE